MATLSSITIKVELRPCLVYGMSGLFHKFTDNGYGIVEFEDGSVSEVLPQQIRFTDNPFKEIAHGDDGGNKQCGRDV